MDKIDRLYQRKKFFKIVFPELNEGECYRIFQTKDEFNKVSFFNDIDEMNKYCENNKFSSNMYFSLSTTNGIGGTEEDLITRYVIGFDFDKKDYDSLDAKDIMYKFKENGLWYHILVDSGNGYHAYLAIDPTVDIDKVVKVTKAIGKKLGADENAMKSTQILRVPLSYNLKNDKKKQVNIIKMYEKETIKRYHIDDLYNRFCCNSCEEKTSTKAIEHSLKTTNLPKCIIELLSNGSNKGDRNSDLQKLVVTLRKKNKKLSEIKEIVKEWNNKNNPSFSEYELQYQIEYIFNKIKNISYDCQACIHKEECFNNIVSDFEYQTGDILLDMNERILKSLKKSRKGVKSMEGNEILIYSILKSHNDGLYRDEIVKELTYKNTCRLSVNTITKTLKSLIDNKFISFIRDKRGSFYRLNIEKSNVEEAFVIGYGATLCCIKNEITTEELRLYNLMRYLHHKIQREGRTNLKGNLFQIDQRDLGEIIGKSQSQISKMIKNLTDEKIISIWYRGVSKNNQFDYNIYRLNL